MTGVGEWIERQPFHQEFWLCSRSHNEQLRTSSEEMRLQLVATQALCLTLTATFLRCATDSGSSPQHALSMLKRIKQAALREIRQSEDADRVSPADIYLSGLIMDLYDRCASTGQK